MLIEFINKFCFDLIFWLVYSLDKHRRSDLYNGDYCDIDEKPVSNIYHHTDYKSGLMCFDMYLLFDGIKKELETNVLLSKKSLYLVNCDFKLSESHYFLMITTFDEVIIFNLYGGSGAMYGSRYPLSEFNVMWKIFLDSNKMKMTYKNKHMVNHNFEKITGIKGIYTSYFLEKITIEIIKDIDIKQKKIISHIIGQYEKYVIADFKHRAEAPIVLKLVDNMKLFCENNGIN